MASASENERLAYAAGLFDGEGHIGISRQGRKQIVVRVSLVMCTPYGPTLFAELFGGSVKLCRRDRKPGWRPLFRWVQTARKAESVIRTLLPWLQDKREQAHIALAIRALQFRPGPPGHSKTQKAQVTELAERLARAKREQYDRAI